MHIMRRQDREDLGINKLDPKVRDYIAALETEYERVTTRQKRLRDNIRAMQRKCELANLKLKMAQMAGQAQTIVVNQDLSAASAATIAKHLASQDQRMRRAV